MMLNRNMERISNNSVCIYGDLQYILNHIIFESIPHKFTHAIPPIKTSQNRKIIFLQTSQASYSSPNIRVTRKHIVIYSIIMSPSRYFNHMYSENWKCPIAGNTGEGLEAVYKDMHTDLSIVVDCYVSALFSRRPKSHYVCGPDSAALSFLSALPSSVMDSFMSAKDPRFGPQPAALRT